MILALIPGILLLNIYLMVPLMTSSINGYDSSLVNGMSGFSRNLEVSELIVNDRSSDCAGLAGVLSSSGRKDSR